MTDLIRVLLADDHPLVRAGIRAIIEAEPDLQLVGEAVDGNEARQLSVELQPDVLLLDLNMPGPSATSTVDYLREQCSTVKVIALTAYDDEGYVRGSISIGIPGYVLKDEATESVVHAIREVARGGQWYSPAVTTRLATWKPKEPSKLDLLSKRETGILRLIVAGQTNREIAANLAISEKTVEKHVSDILNKLGVNTRVGAVVIALHDHLLLDAQQPTV